MGLLKKKLCLIIAMLFMISSCPLFACDNEDDNIDANQPSQEELEILSELDYEFQSQYTTEQHMQRIKDIMWDPNRSLLYPYNMDSIKDIFVEVMYSYYTEDPEYFLIEIEYKESFVATTADVPFLKEARNQNYLCSFQYLVVKVDSADRYEIVTEGDYYSRTLINAPSVYRVKDYLGYKKYYSTYDFGMYGIKKDGKIFQVFKWVDFLNVPLLVGITSWEDERFNFVAEERELTKAEQAEYLVWSREYGHDHFPIYI